MCPSASSPSCVCLSSSPLIAVSSLHCRYREYQDDNSDDDSADRSPVLLSPRSHNEKRSRRRSRIQVRHLFSLSLSPPPLYSPSHFLLTPHTHTPLQAISSSLFNPNCFQDMFRKSCDDLARMDSQDDLLAMISGERDDSDARWWLIDSRAVDCTVSGGNRVAPDSDGDVLRVTSCWRDDV